MCHFVSRIYWFKYHLLFPLYEEQFSCRVGEKGRHLF